MARCQRDPWAPYDPRQVQGQVIPLKHIDSLVRVAVADPTAARMVIHPKQPDSMEFETVVSGLIALEIFLRREKKDEFVVCGDGTRYGVVWKVALAESSREN